MSSVKGTTASIGATLCLVAVLVAVPSAQAAVTASSITAPTNLTYLIYNFDNPNTFAVSGTTSGTTGDHVDLVCFDGDGHHTVASNVAVNPNGSFSAPADAESANTYRACNLKAVPAGTTPGDLSPFMGPRVLVGKKEMWHLDSGPNNGALYDWYVYFSQLAGGMDYESLGSCGIDDAYLLDSNNASATTTWYCNAYLDDSNVSPGTRSEIQVNGKNAYTADGAQSINPNATSGFPALTESFSLNPHTGNGTIHERDAFVTCPNATYPPTGVTCPTFVPTGLTDTRTITQDHAGKVAWITDVFKNSTGKAQTLDLLWQNYERFRPDATGDSTKIEYQFPGQTGFSMHVLNDAVTLPASSPATILVRVHGAADGDTSTGQGAIVYDRPADKATFQYINVGSEGFTLHQKATVPAHGSVRFRFAYVQGFLAAQVGSLARQATTIFKGCTVPNVAGKTLAAAKSAITHAHCAVGKIAHDVGSTIPAGHVISTRPRAKTHVDYGTKVTIDVSG